MISALSLKNPVSGHERHGCVSAPASPSAVMLIVHGFGEHSGRYLGMMEHFAEAGVAVMALDLEGHGQSEGPPGVVHSYDILLADVDLLMNQANARFPGVPVILYGHSMGGGLALHYVLKNGAQNLAGVIASAPLIHPADPVPRPLRAIVKLLRKLAPNKTLGNTISGDKISTLTAEQSRYENDPLNHGRLGIGLAVDIIEGGEWVAENAGKWTAPLLLMHAEQDKLTRFDSSRDFAALAQNCTFMPVFECEHEMHNDIHRDQVYAAMLSFIRDRT